jgi:hydrogenase small subunit
MLFTLTLSGLGSATLGCSNADTQSDATTNELSDFELSGRPKADIGPDSRLPIIWIEAGVCTGCAVTLLGSIEPTIESVLPLLRLEFQETLMDRSGASTMDRLLAISSELSGKFLLIVDGTVPTGPSAPATTLGVTSEDYELTAQDLVTHLAQRAAAILALGTCASFGGITAAAPNPANHRPVSDCVPTGMQLIRLPGCPPHPSWILETLITILTKGLSQLYVDSLARPLSIYGKKIHDLCTRRGAFENGDFAEAPGDPERCLYTVGCKGPDTSADCPERTWGGRSSCIQTNHPCIGCASPGFPDARSDFGDEGSVSMSPTYR